MQAATGFDGLLTCVSPLTFHSTETCVVCCSDGDAPVSFGGGLL